MPDFKTAEAQQFWDYWRSLQGGRLVPLKSQFSPGGIPHLMPDLFMLKYESRDVCRFTLVGTHHTARCEEELTGTNFLDRIGGAAKTIMAEAMSRIIDHPVANHLLYEEITAKGRRTRLEMIQLPLAYADGSPHSIIGLSKEMAVAGYDMTSAPPHTYMSQTVEQTYIDIGAGVPATICLDTKAAPL